MLETMRDRGKFWTPAPDRAVVRIEREGLSARFLSGLGQTLVSGDLDAALSTIAPGAPEFGLWGLADTESFSVRVARDRALLVTPAPLAVVSGWRDGFVATPCDDAFAVVEISGEGLLELVSEATSVSLDAGSRSAAVLFAGVTVFLYRSGPATARLHVEAPLAAYLWSWLEERG